MNAIVVFAQQNPKARALIKARQFDQAAILATT
jgi:hypothetical protein